MAKVHVLRQKAYSRSGAGGLVNFVLLLILAAMMALPMAFTVVNAFKPISELFIFPPKLWVSNPTLANFQGIAGVLRESIVPLERYILNSVIITGLGVVGQVVIASLAAYVLAKEEFPGRAFFNSTIVLALMFNGAVTQIPSYIVMAKVGLVNTLGALILPTFCSTVGLYLMRQFMEQMVHDAILEAARIDGAGELHIFFKIVMPMCKPAWLTLIILAFQGAWGNTGGLFIYDEQLKTLPYAMQNVMSSGIIARAGISSATALLLIVPPLAAFILSQSNILETMTASGMKD